MSLTNKIISGVLLLISIILGYFLVSGIKFTMDEDKRIAAIEKKVITRLELIREAEKAYQSVKGVYTNNWDSLAAFVENDVFYVTQRSEEIFTLDYGADSVVINIDTLGTKPVMDSLFSADKFKSFDFRNLKYIPETENAVFNITAGKIERGGVRVAVLLVVDSKPADPNRRESNELRLQKPLRIGSMEEVTLSGNWE